MMLWWCYDDVVMMLRWCYDDAMMMLWWCYDDVMMIIWWCYDDDVTMTLWWYNDYGIVIVWWCYDDAVMMLRWCYAAVIMMLSWCYHDVIMMLSWCYYRVMAMLWWRYYDVMIYPHFFLPCFDDYQHWLCISLSKCFTMQYLVAVWVSVQMRIHNNAQNMYDEQGGHSCQWPSATSWKRPQRCIWNSVILIWMLVCRPNAALSTAAFVRGAPTIDFAFWISNF